jgi:hypothetical protein
VIKTRISNCLPKFGALAGMEISKKASNKRLAETQKYLATWLILPKTKFPLPYQNVLCSRNNLGKWTDIPGF